VEELGQLMASGAVRSLKVVDSDGQHVLNLAVRNKQDAVVQVGLCCCCCVGWCSLQHCFQMKHCIFEGGYCLYHMKSTVQLP
jgi:hypothetical protein